MSLKDGTKQLEERLGALRKANKELEAQNRFLEREIEALKRDLEYKDRETTILNQRLDPDPYGYHGIPLSVRIETMTVQPR